MIKLNISFIDIIKNIILTDRNLKYYYNNKFPNSKYLLDTIIKDILYVLKSGVSWRDSRSCINWNSLFWHFKRFTKFNIFKRLFKILTNGYAKNHSIDIQIIDSSFILNKLGKNNIARNKFFKNKNCNKISMVTDKNGIPLSILFDSGNVHDLSFVNNHIDDLYVLNKRYSKSTKSILADKGYVSATLKESLVYKNYNLIYPTKSNMKPNLHFDKLLYKKRINVEHSFAMLKSFKRIQFRYDSDFKSYLSFVYLACSLMVHRKIS